MQSDGLILLAAFIERHTTQAAFAEKIGCSEPHLSNILKGRRGISLRLAKRIATATRGKVPIHKLPDQAAA